MPAGASSKTHVFPGVTLQALASLRDQPATPGQGGANYSLKLDPDGTGGLFTVNIGIGDVVLRFDHNAERAELTMSIVKKPMLVPSSAIFSQASQVLREAANRAGQLNADKTKS
jgi:hypothetical protein